jgi:predicted O-methyltransferase YrrM
MKKSDLVKAVGAKKERQAVIDSLKAMADEPKHKPIAIGWLEAEDYRYDMRVALRTIAKLMKPKLYLEIGVWRGWSMAQVLDVVPTVRAVGIDLWKSNYAGVATSSPDFVTQELSPRPVTLLTGDSAKVMQGMINKAEKYDLILVDGDHTTQGAIKDLFTAVSLLADGGVLIFDDLVPGTEGGSKTMVEVWADFKAAYPDLEYVEFDDPAVLIPFGVAIKPKADRPKVEDPQRKRKSQELPTVVMMSLWRNDANKKLRQRAEHLINKRNLSSRLRWVWIVGDSDDDTEAILRQTAAEYWSMKLDITVVRHDTGIEGEDSNTRVRRLSLTANAGFDLVRDNDDYWLIHESDLQSPDDLVERFVKHAEDDRCPIAGWPTLDGNFYDTWAYIDTNGENFNNNTKRPDRWFEVLSVGSCWMLHAEDLRAGLRCEKFAVVELCDKLRADHDRRLWVDPAIQIIQPREFFRSRSHATR